MPEFIPAVITRLDTPGEYLVESASPIQGIAPGQFGVIYDENSHLCYGSGVITGQNVIL